MMSEGLRRLQPEGSVDDEHGPVHRRLLVLLTASLFLAPNLPANAQAPATETGPVRYRIIESENTRQPAPDGDRYETLGLHRESVVELRRTTDRAAPGILAHYLESTSIETRDGRVSGEHQDLPPEEIVDLESDDIEDHGDERTPPGLDLAAQAEALSVRDDQAGSSWIILRRVRLSEGVDLPLRLEIALKCGPHGEAQFDVDGSAEREVDMDGVKCTLSGTTAGTVVVVDGRLERLDIETVVTLGADEVLLVRHTTRTRWDRVR